MKKIIPGILVLIIIVGIVFYFANDKVNAPIGENNTNQKYSYKDATYGIEGEKVVLKNGVSSVPGVSGSSSTILTQYFGNEVYHDFDKDGREDVVFLLTQNGGGTGTFYYVVVALNKEDGYVGSEGFYLGDRIAPQSIEMSKNSNTPNVIVVNYADRKPTDSFTTPPSVGKTVWLMLDLKTMQFGTVEQNFAGEADPNRMNLTMKTWNWVRAEYNDGRVITPRTPNKFTITFKSDGTFGASTDCNGVGGDYKVTGDRIEMTDMISTLMFCEGSQESEFRKMLETASGFHFTSKGELILDLKFDSGSVTFR